MRAEPKTLIAGPSSASAPKPSMNSAWILITRQGSLWSQSAPLPPDSRRVSVVWVGIWSPRRSTGPLR